MTSLDRFAETKLARIRAASRERRIIPTARDQHGGVTRNGKRLISFCCNDYLNLAHHPEVKARAKEAIDLYGAGAGGSRMVTGDHPLISELENRLARLKGTDAAVVFGSGFLANIGIVPCFVGPDDVIFMDELSHACLFSGAKLSGSEVHVFRHNDMAHLAELLGAHRASHPHALILTDGVFSMDGDLAPLDVLVPLAEAHDAWLLTDDAHGVGVLGGGRGSSFLTAEKARVPLQMGTLSKAIGSYGGYLCASRTVIDFVKNRARSIIFTTGLPPASAAAAIAAIDIFERDADLRAEPVRKARLFTTLTGLPQPESCIVPVIIGASDKALAASKALEEQGFLVVAIRPPTVAEGTARLRITFTAAHDDADVIRLAKAVCDLGLVAQPQEAV